MAETDRFSYTHYVSEQRETEAFEHRSEIVKKLLTRLPESERTVMTLYYLGEMPAKEIGKFLGVSVKTVHSRLHRARKRLQEKDELLIGEVLGGVQLPASLIENITRQVANIKPTPAPAGKPLLPWAALGAATVLIVLLLGATNQYLARFQKPYSFEAVAEPTVEIVDTAILLDIDAKPDLRNQVGRPASTDKNIGAGLQAAETPLVSDTQRKSLGPATLQWTRKADMPTARIGFATSVVNGKVFVIGGNIQLKRGEFGDLSTSTVEMYDPKTDTWERKSDMPTARSGVSVSVVDGKIYAIGGTKTKTIQVPRGFSSENEELATVEMYDPVTDTWTQKADIPTPKKTMTCVVNGKIYAVGGWLTTNEKPHLETVEVYDPGTDTWAKAQSMNCARCSAAIG
ncbi:MAG: sigma-70 family RNA polymerase sigma factor, partial [Candidatus Poribacteria bacterium]|nr:sigma-70 family RNA polymerase sigma factor [Candidatus Poribacteria bacterium]